METRTDHLMAVHVDLAVSLSAVHGVAVGARELRERGAPLELARRVLLQPGRRRGAGRRWHVHHLVADQPHE